MNKLNEDEINQGYKLLFDGSTLEGWAVTTTPMGSAESVDPNGWLVKDGNIVLTGNSGGYLYTVEQFEDFIFHMEYRTEPDVNSGIFFRWSDLVDPVNTGLEMQIWDTYDKKELVRNSSGALYDLVAPSSNAVRKAGEWNEVTIRCDRNLIQLTLNGEMIVEADIDQWSVAGKNPDGSDNKFKYAMRDLPRLGYIGFQDHQGYAEFRNIKIKVLNK